MSQARACMLLFFHLISPPLKCCSEYSEDAGSFQTQPQCTALKVAAVDAMMKRGHCSPTYPLKAEEKRRRRGGIGGDVKASFLDLQRPRPKSIGGPWTLHQYGHKTQTPPCIESRQGGAIKPSPSRFMICTRCVLCKWALLPLHMQS